MSELVFHGGPLDGTSEPVKEGFPAPDRYCSPDGTWYRRVEVRERESGTPAHHYIPNAERGE